MKAAALRLCPICRQRIVRLRPVRAPAPPSVACERVCPSCGPQGSYAGAAAAAVERAMRPST